MIRCVMFQENGLQGLSNSERYSITDSRPNFICMGDDHHDL